MLKNEYVKKVVIAIVAFLVTIGIFIYFHSISPFIYQMNDDYFLKTIASGEVTGSPEAMLMHIGFLSGLVIRFMYTIFPAAPCFGLFLYASYGVTIFVVLYKLLTYEKKIWTRILTIGLTILVAYGFLFLHIVEVQYTVVTGMVSAGALFLFALSENENSWKKYLRNNIGFLALVVWAFSIRDKGFLMMLPFVFMIAIGKYIDAGIEEKSAFLKLNQKRKSIFVLAIVFFILLLGVWGIKRIAYGSDTWSTFLKYNTDRETVYDYDGYPDYETHQDFYQQIGLSESSFEAAAHRYNLILEPAINQSSMTEIASVAESERKASLSGHLSEKIQSMWDAFVDRNLSYTDRPLNLLVYGLYVLFFGISILGRRYGMIRDLICLIAARMVTWTYLLYIGRMPSRVTQPLYLVELAVLLAIAYRRKAWKSKILWCLTVLFIVGASIRFGMPKAKAAAGEALSRVNFSQSFVEMKEYFAEHSENFYYLDMNSFGSFTEEVLKGGQNTYDNYMYMGSWEAKSPWYDQKFQIEGIKDPACALLNEEDAIDQDGRVSDGRVYAVFMKTDETSWDYLEAYYQENYPGSKLEVVDEVTTSAGITFEILAGEMTS